MAVVVLVLLLLLLRLPVLQPLLLLPQLRHQRVLLLWR